MARHLRENYHDYGRGIFLPDYRVIANEVAGSFWRIWDTGARNLCGTPVFGTERVEPTGTTSSTHVNHE